MSFRNSLLRRETLFPGSCCWLKERGVSDLVEVSVQEAAGQVRGCIHQLEEAHKVVAVDCSERLDRKPHLGRVAHVLAELLHLPAWTWGGFSQLDRCDTNHTLMFLQNSFFTVGYDTALLNAAL